MQSATENYTPFEKQLLIYRGNNGVSDHGASNERVARTVPHEPVAVRYTKIRWAQQQIIRPETVCEWMAQIPMPLLSVAMTPLPQFTPIVSWSGVE